MGEGASFALVSPRPPPHGRAGLLCFGTTEAPTAWAWGPPCVRGRRDGEDGSAHGHLREKCRAPGEGGVPGHGPSPRDLPAKRRPVGSTWRAKGPHL